MKPTGISGPARGRDRDQGLSRIDHAVQEPLRVAILDDHEVVCFGVERLISHYPEFKWAGAARSSREIFGLLASTPCHLLVMDYELGAGDMDGWNLLTALRVRFPHVRILVYSAHAGAFTSEMLLNGGAGGFLAKPSRLDALVCSLRALARAPLPTADRPGVVREGARSRLTSRECEVVRCCLQGMSGSEIASKIRRSEKTVSSHKRSAFRKLGISSGMELFRAYEGRTHPDLRDPGGNTDDEWPII